MGLEEEILAVEQAFRIDKVELNKCILEVCIKLFYFGFAPIVSIFRFRVCPNEPTLFLALPR